MLLIILASIVTSAVSVQYPHPKVNRTALREDEWWGPEDMKDNQDISVRPARIEFTDEMITDLRSRLRNHNTFQPPLNDVGFEYGFNSHALNSWIHYWSEEYSFKERERELNKFPQYKTNIQGMDIHFVWVKPQTQKKTVPLLLLHGWPGSILEFYEAIPLLTSECEDRDFVVEVIVPFLPGYGFSEAAVRSGLGAAQVAVVMRNLMKRLGFDKFYIQAGDIGSTVGSNMATLYSKDVLGFHSNLALVVTSQSLGFQIVGALNPSSIVDPELEDRMYPLLDKLYFILEEFGYFHIQATKPDTIGTALTDSPSGLLAYILEKFSTGVTPENRRLRDGGLNKTFTPESLIDNLMMHWAPRRFTSAMRLYAETYNKKQTALGISNTSTPVPTYVLQAKHELAYQPPLILKLKYSNLVKAKPVEFGGHFFAMEEPKFFAENVLEGLELFFDWHKDNEIV